MPNITVTRERVENDLVRTEEAAAIFFQEWERQLCGEAPQKVCKYLKDWHWVTAFPGTVNEPVASVYPVIVSLTDVAM